MHIRNIQNMKATFVIVVQSCEWGERESIKMIKGTLVIL